MKRPGSAGIWAFFYAQDLSATVCRSREGLVFQGLAGICCQLLPCQKRGFSLPSGGFFAQLVLTRVPARAGHRKLMGDD
jgi:hypothetical protein